MKRIATLVLASAVLSVGAVAPSWASEAGQESPQVDVRVDDPVLWSACDTYTFAINPGTAPRKQVRAARNEFSKAARMAGLQVRYVGTTGVTPVPDPGARGNADFILSFDTASPRVLAHVHSFYAITNRTKSPVVADLPPGVTGVPHENIVYAGAVIPWKQLRKQSVGERKAIVLHVIGSMLGLETVDNRAREVMSLNPQGDGAWTPGFSRSLLSLYSGPSCAAAPEATDVSFVTQDWGGAKMLLQARPASSTRQDEVFGFDVFMDFHGQRDSEHFFAPITGSLSDGARQATEILDPSTCKTHVTVSVTPISYSGIRGEALVSDYPQGAFPCPL